MNLSDRCGATGLPPPHVQVDELLVKAVKLYVYRNNPPCAILSCVAEETEWTARLKKSGTKKFLPHDSQEFGVTPREVGLRLRSASAGRESPDFCSVHTVNQGIDIPGSPKNPSIPTARITALSVRGLTMSHAERPLTHTSADDRRCKNTETESPQLLSR